MPETRECGTMIEALNIFVTSVRDGFVQVSAFVAITILIFGYIQYRTKGAITRVLQNNRKWQPVAGALLGLTPGCGGAIIAMPLYIRGTISFGTVVATLVATAGDSAFVIIALAPKAAVFSYAIAFVAGVAFGYMIDYFGMGVSRIDQAVAKFNNSVVSGGHAIKNLATGGPSVAVEGPEIPPNGDRATRFRTYGSGTVDGLGSGSGDSLATVDRGEDERSAHDTREGSSVMTKISHAVLAVWWVVAIAGVIAGVAYLVLGAPAVEFEFGLSFFGLFTVAGLVGTTLSFYNHFVGRRYLGERRAGRGRDTFDSTYDTLKHAAMETSMVTVWVIGGYLVYEYVLLIFSLDIQAIAVAAGILAPIAGALLGLIPGCALQIVFAGIYANGALPFSALTANAISQDGDALFPLMAIDLKAAIVATIYTTIPALVAGILLHFFWPFAQFGFGVLG